MGDAVKQGHDGQDGHRQRKDDANQDLQVGAAVNLRRFLYFDGDILLEKGAHNDDVPYGERIRDDKRPHRVDHAEIFHQQIGRNEPAAEKHRKYEKGGKVAASGQIFARQRIGGEYRHNDINSRPDNGVQDRIPVALQNVVVLEHFLVSAERDALRPQPHLSAQNFGRIANRGGQHEQQRIQDGDQGENEQSVDDETEHSVAKRLFYHKLVSPAFRAM